MDAERPDEAAAQPAALVPPTPNPPLPDPVAERKLRKRREELIGVCIGMFVVIPLAVGIALAVNTGLNALVAGKDSLGIAGIFSVILGLALYIGPALLTMRLGYPEAGKAIFLALPLDMALALLLSFGACIFSPSGLIH